MKMSRWDYIKPIVFETVPDGFKQFRQSHLFISEEAKVWNGILESFVCGKKWEEAYQL
jgi:hypothetical protein